MKSLRPLCLEGGRGEGSNNVDWCHGCIGAMMSGLVHEEDDEG